MPKMETYFEKIIDLEKGQTAYYILVLSWFSLLMYLNHLNKSFK